MSQPRPTPGQEIVTIYIEVPVGFAQSRDDHFWTNVELTINLLMRLSNPSVNPTVWKADQC